MKKKVQFTPIEYPQINSYIHYFIERDIEIANKVLASKGCEYEARGSGATYWKAGKDPIVWLSSKRIDIVVHEMYHAVAYMLRDIGLEHTKETEEIYVYFTEYAIKQVLKRLVKKYTIACKR
jgi:hypothetical protein